MYFHRDLIFLSFAVPFLWAPVQATSMTSTEHGNALTHRPRMSPAVRIDYIIDNQILLLNGQWPASTDPCVTFCADSRNWIQTLTETKLCLYVCLSTTKEHPCTGLDRLTSVVFHNRVSHQKWNACKQYCTRTEASLGFSPTINRRHLNLPTLIPSVSWWLRLFRCLEYVYENH